MKHKDKMNKICRMCSLEKPIEEFTLIKDRGNKQRRYSYCKACHKINQRRWRKTPEGRKSGYITKKNKKQERFRIKVLSKYGCSLCPERDVRVLEFDHIDPSTKSETISHMIKRSAPLKHIKAEMRKCQVLCNNCHIKKSTKDNNDIRQLKKFGRWDRPKIREE